jgi:hypothetical protein
MRKLIIGFILVTVLGAVVWYTPKYLAYADQPVKPFSTDVS